jgi:soluble lytic murein transglycosylase-like protein
MARLLAILPLLGLLAGASPAAGDDIYSFVDHDGVIHVTNVPQDSRYRKRGRIPAARTKVLAGGVTRIALGRAPPVMLRATSAYDEHIRAAATKYGLAPPLLKAVMAVESNFNPAAVSMRGATGLMQLMPETARDMYVYDLLDPAQNIDGGARYLKLLQDRFEGDLEKVLAAYNAGPEAVRRCGGSIPPFPETQAYVRKVLALYDSYMRGR